MAWLRSCGGGNPYLRYDKENDQIQAMDDQGNWENIYATSKLPLESKLWLIKDGVRQNNLSRVNVTNNVSITDNDGYVSFADAGPQWQMSSCYFTFTGDLHSYSKLFVNFRTYMPSSDGGSQPYNPDSVSLAFSFTTATNITLNTMTTPRLQCGSAFADATLNIPSNAVAIAAYIANQRWIHISNMYLEK